MPAYFSIDIEFDKNKLYSNFVADFFYRQVQNNRERFRGNDFMFQLTEEEFENLKCYYFTSSWGGRRKLPYAFPEEIADLHGGTVNVESTLGKGSTFTITIPAVE